jgi:PEP-CTERM motif
MRALRIRFGITMAVMACVATCAGQSSAAPIVTEITTGTSGDYTLNFSVTNNLNGINSIYFFGVMMDSGNVIAGSPAGFDTHFDAWSNAHYGGSSLVYNLTWIDNNTFPIPFGTTQNGFIIQSTDTALPTSIPWFAYGEQGTYTGNDYFNIPTNPGFEGVVSPQFAVPEPSTFLLGLLGSLGGFGYFCRSKSRTGRHETR